MRVKCIKLYNLKSSAQSLSFPSVGLSIPVYQIMQESMNRMVSKGILRSVLCAIAQGSMSGLM